MMESILNTISGLGVKPVHFHMTLEFLSASARSSL